MFQIWFLYLNLKKEKYILIGFKSYTKVQAKVLEYLLTEFKWNCGKIWEF